jgi:hypothetical protein
MGFKEIFGGIVIPVLGALIIGISFLALGSMRDVLLTLGGTFVGQITRFYDDVTQLKNKVFEANKKGKAAFLLGCDMGPFLLISGNTTISRNVVDKGYRHIATELEVLGLSIAEDLLDLLKETVSRPRDDVLESKIKMTLDYTTEILATIQSPLNYIFHFGLKFTTGQIILIRGSMTECENVLQILEDYSKEIKNKKLYSDFHKEVVDKAIKIFREEIDKKRRGEVNISDVQKVSDFIEDVRISLHPS